MLMPKRTKYRRVQRGRMKGAASRGNKVSYGEFGIQALEPGWITGNQIEAARVAMTRYTKRGGQVWIYKGEILSQSLRTTPRTMYLNKRDDRRRDRRDGDRRGRGGYNRDRRDGNRQGGRPGYQGGGRPQGGNRPQGGYNRGPRPAAPAAPKEGGNN